MARLLLYRDALFYMHAPPRPHPEGPWRLDEAYRGLGEAGVLAYASERPAPPRGRARRELLRVHDESYVALVEKLSSRGRGWLDADTYVNAYTFDAGLAVASAVLDALDAVLRGEGPVLVLARPPGHHAGRYGAAMGAPTLGFCIFNATALAAVRAADLGYRVLVLDFDLHHGNGTQEILYRDPRVVHLDLHQDPATIYPGTGWPWETGEGEARGTKINIPVPLLAGDDVYQWLLEQGMELALEALGGTPDLVLVDAGFDAYSGDGLGALELTTNTYAWIGWLLRRLTSKVLVVLEGGYSQGLRRGLPAFAATLSGVDAAPPLEDETRSPHRVWGRAEETMHAVKKNIIGYM